MPRFLYKLLYKNTIVSKRWLCLLLAQFITFKCFCIIPCYAHSFTTSSSWCFNHYWILNFIGYFKNLLVSLNNPEKTWHSVDISLTSQFLWLDLVTHRYDGLLWWSNKLGSCFLNSVLESWVLWEKSVSWMNSIRSCLFYDVDNLIYS